MGAAMHGEGRRRDDGGARALALAFAGSLLLHAVLFGLFPKLRELSARIPPEPLPLIARLVRPAPPPMAEESEPGISAPRAKDAPRKTERRPAAVAAPRAEPAPTPDRAPVPPAKTVPMESPLPPAPRAAIAPPPEPATPATIASAPTLTPAPVVVAPDARAIEGYRRDVTDRAARYKRYPRVAIDNDWQGEVVVRMTIGADGRIASLRIERGSGYEVLDRQALEMFRNAKPLVPVPSALRGHEFEFELRAVYSLRDGRPG